MGKAYTSPLTLFKHFGLGADSSNISLFKKKALAELDLLGTSTLKINNKEYSKNDILNFADSLQGMGNMEYHQAVLEDPFLLDFLELKIVKYDGQLLHKSLYEDINFINWISPYVLHAQSRFAEAFLNQNDIKGWNKLSGLCKFLTGNDENEYLNFLDHTIRKRKDKIQHCAESKPMSVSELLKLCDNRFVQMLISLPEARFAELRDELGLLMNNMGVKIFNQKDQTQGKGLMFVAKECCSSVDLKNTINENIKRMNEATRNEQGTSSSSSGTDSGWKVFWAILAVIVMLFRIARCANNL